MFSLLPLLDGEGTTDFVGVSTAFLGDVISELFTLFFFTSSFVVVD
jgi:hypothetical protein